MNKKETVQEVYSRFRHDCGMDTMLCLQFLEWLHKEKNELVFLKDMPGLTIIETSYINNLLGN